MPLRPTGTGAIRRETKREAAHDTRPAKAQPVSAAKPAGWPESSLNPLVRMKVARYQEDLVSDAGQAGDTTELPDIATANSESVKNLVEEGQDFEAEIISGVEKAADSRESKAKARRRNRRISAQ